MTDHLITPEKTDWLWALLPLDWLEQIKHLHGLCMTKMTIFLLVEVQIYKVK